MTKIIKNLINHMPLLMALFAAFAIYSTATMAGTLYRCGNSFQDTPCQGATNATSSKPLKTTKTDNNVTAQNSNSQPQKVDSDCKARGDASKNISWDREVGVTMEAQIEKNKYAPNLIKEVYSHRGSSLEVKSMIEQDCMQQKLLDSLAAKLEADASRLRRAKAISVDPAVANTQSAQ